MISAASILLATVLPAGGGCVTPSNETCDGQIVFDTDDLPLDTSGIIGCVNNVIDKPYWDIFYRYDCFRSGANMYCCPTGISPSSSSSG